MQQERPANRLDLYKEEIRLTPGLMGDSEEHIAAALDAQKAVDHSSLHFIWELTKEIIYSHEPTPTFAHIMYGLDPKTFEIVIAHVLSTVDADENDNRYHLASAVGFEIPVFPNSSSDAPHLEALYERLLDGGFYHEKGGTRRWLKLTGKVAPLEVLPNPADHLVFHRLLSSMELSVIRKRVTARLHELSSAQLTLDRIDLAIRDLESCLSSNTRNENDLQACLTNHPILFGPDYRRVIPKHRLGSEYEMDYALELHSGLVDLVEIESSTLELYTKRGEPRSELVHAEQQVFDWLEWMEAHGGYAREKLPALRRPRAFIVIGRSASLTDVTAAKLQQRNRLLGHVLEISTYDGLLERTRQLRNILSGMPENQQITN